jgi:MFS family permease
MSYETGSKTRRGFLISTREWKVVFLATSLMIVNIGLIYALVTTPLAALNQALFAAPILGVIVYGVALFIGEWIAERGVMNGNGPLAFIGLVILQGAFGTFGAGVLSFAPPDLRIVALGITAAVTGGLTFLIALYVYARSKSFERWATFSTITFLLGIGAIAVGTFVAPVLLLAGFVFIFAGFLFRLGWEIWRVRERRDLPATLAAIGVYIAVMGVFVHVLQIVLRMLARRE